MKRKLINQNWFKQRLISQNTFKNEAYLKHLELVHSLPMSELIEACKLMVIWVPDMRKINAINQ